MKRILVAVLVLALLVVVGISSISAQTIAIANNVSIPPVNRVWAAWQPFERGVMMWWSDLNQVWVLINQPAGSMTQNAYIYTDAWQGESAPNFGAPPAGRFSAVRGFGRVWGLLGGPTSQLGWALAPEIGYDSASRSITNGVITIGGPGNTVYTVTFLPTAQAGMFNGVGVYTVVNIG
jgi:hypothetical protein